VKWQARYAERINLIERSLDHGCAPVAPRSNADVSKQILEDSDILRLDGEREGCSSVLIHDF